MVQLRWMLLAMVVCAVSARASTSVEISAMKDVTLFGGAAASTNNTSSGPAMFVGADNNGALKRAMIAFDIAANIPSGATIDSATLTLYLGALAGQGAGDQTVRTISLYDVAKVWNGSTLGTTGLTKISGSGSGFNPPNTGDATWNYAQYNSLPWTNPGGDFVPTATATQNISSVFNSAYSWSSAQMINDVQGWLDGTLENDGWLLKNSNETAADYRAFYTREGASELGVSQYAPQLTVTYSVPEPVLLSLAPAMFLVMRRRGTGYQPVKK